MTIDNDIVVETHGLTKHFYHQTALDDVTLQIRRSGVHAIIGANGAGKSTLFRLLLGFETPTKGEASVLGESSGNISTETRGRIAYVDGSFRQSGWRTVEDLRRLQSAVHAGWNEALFHRVLALFNVGTRRKIGELSSGGRAGVSVALAFAQGAELMILDEPTLGLDIVAKEAVLETLMFDVDLQQVTVIFCSHDMDEIERAADEMILIDNGRLAVQSGIDEFHDRIGHWMARVPSTERLAATVPGLLSMKIVDGVCHFSVMDSPENLPELFSALGIADVQQIAHGFGHSIRAYLKSTMDVSGQHFERGRNV